MYAELLASVPEEYRVDIRSAGGSGAGLLLLPPEEESHVLPDDHLAVALRRRLRFPFAARGVAPTLLSHCNHPLEGYLRSNVGRARLPRRYARVRCGGGVVQRHNAIRDWLAAWLERFTGRTTSTEAFVEAWNRPVVDGAGQAVWEEAAAGPRRLEGGVLVDV